MTGLASLLEMVGRGQPLPADGEVTLLPAPMGAATAAVLGFTAHHVIAADVDPDWVRAQLGDASDGADLGRPMQPDFLSALGRHLGARPEGQDVLLVAPASTSPNESPAEAVDPASLDSHRVDRAMHYRQDVAVATLPGGLVTTGRGLAGRWEISVEVRPDCRGKGIGRALARLGRTLVPEGELGWAQVHPANVASLRAFLAAGFRPVGAEVLFSALHSHPPT